MSVSYLLCKKRNDSNVFVPLSSVDFVENNVTNASGNVLGSRIVTKNNHSMACDKIVMFIRDVQNKTLYSQDLSCDQHYA